MPYSYEPGGAGRTVIEHFVGGVDPILSAKALTTYTLHFDSFPAFVFDNDPVSYPIIQNLID